jgi:hypothetical protein
MNVVRVPCLLTSTVEQQLCLGDTWGDTPRKLIQSDLLQKPMLAMSFLVSRLGVYESQRYEPNPICTHSIVTNRTAWILFCLNYTIDQYLVHTE